jgi:hypothetical protein
MFTEEEFEEWEEKGLPHSTNPLLIAVNEAIKNNS